MPDGLSTLADLIADADRNVEDSETEAGKRYGISRQAVNKKKKRIFEKLRDKMLN